MPVRICRVSFTDSDGIRHETRVQAESLYEAVALAAGAFRSHDCYPGPASRIEVEVCAPSVTHTVTMRKVLRWLDRACKNPSEKVLKERLKRSLD